MSSEPVAIVVAPDGVSGSLTAIVDRLTSSGVVVRVVDDLPAAAGYASLSPQLPPCLLLDLRGLGSEVEDIKEAAERIRRALSALPRILPIAITAEAEVVKIVALVRAGAADVIDIRTEGTANARAVVTRVYQLQMERARDATTTATLRTMVEDMLKDLIRTERRSIDLEEKLAQFESVTGEMPGIGETRPPSILLVEPQVELANELADRLEAAGVSTFAYTTGEDATREVDTLIAHGTDLALVAAQLPGIDGLETVRRLRDRMPGLPAFLMTSVHDADLASRAADLGVVGFVQKPLPDLAEVVARLAQLTRESLARTREQIYLQRIKARHERVLARYRSLPREP